MAERKTVLITGASRGIGRDAAELFARNGWRVFAAVREMRGVRFDSPEISLVQMDVDSLPSIQRAFQLAGKRFDAVVNNAGFGLYGPFESYSDKDMETQIRTNVLGVARVTKTAIPYMNLGGVIINISSVLGHIGAPCYSMYSASKFAVVGMSEALSHELAGKKLRVKIVEPAAVNTGFFKTPDKPPPEYAALSRKADAYYRKSFNKGDDAQVISRLIFTAATDGKDKLYYRPRAAKMPLFLKKLLPSERFVRYIRGKLK